MSISLYEHNQAAYDAALDMLAEKRKAAVVHPTGTGKSYIAFKLCEQFPDKSICCLSPSEYIYKTQLENLKEDSEGWQPENVTIFTYAKLMLMTDEKLKEIKPDYIILSVLKEYYDAHENVDVPYDLATPDGVNVWYWLNKQKKRYLSGKLEQERIVLLNDLDIHRTNAADSCS